MDQYNVNILMNLLRFETGSPCIVQANPELAMPLPQPPNYWDYRHVLPGLSLIFLFLHR